jgi:hypothetical protein
MHRVFNLPDPPPDLAGYLGTSLEQNDRRLRRRAVLSRQGRGSWALVCCTTEAFPHPTDGEEPLATRRYPEAVLFEDWLMPDECRRFIDDIQGGKLTFGDIVIERQGTANWQCERLPLKNDFMARAGLRAAAYVSLRPRKSRKYGSRNTRSGVSWSRSRSASSSTCASCWGRRERAVRSKSID